MTSGLIRWWFPFRSGGSVAAAQHSFLLPTVVSDTLHILIVVVSNLLQISDQVGGRRL
jgi:hypothetical protein